MRDPGAYQVLIALGAVTRSLWCLFLTLNGV
ncbi:hypothetical protein KPSA1_03926 [Pseudomonas syringae pv. actinidiae]|uniref:Uncharacterized protein n=1 Tax=Pseudomonas syringae pv. actinidiae TaxID=103796 RepID=A0A2V0QIN8_PSESF|nr:hypothetical protein KPSA1_03926 [Pseudomonas syringae pv. actinidiae]